jgi:hypothetical protein
MALSRLAGAGDRRHRPDSLIAVHLSSVSYLTRIQLFFDAEKSAYRRNDGDAHLSRTKLTDAGNLLYDWGSYGYQPCVQDKQS